MPNLFGIDVAGIIAAGFKGLLRPVTLTKCVPSVRTAGSLTAGTQPTQTAYACEGFVDNTSEMALKGTLVTVGGQYVSILGASLPGGIVPEKGDKITVDGNLYTIVSIFERDPAAALYKCEVEI